MASMDAASAKILRGEAVVPRGVDEASEVGAVRCLTSTIRCLDVSTVQDHYRHGVSHTVSSLIFHSFGLVRPAHSNAGRDTTRPRWRSRNRVR